jgi:hypothetical protein
LKINQIRLKEVDDSFTLLQPSRTIEIKTDLGSIKTPNRGITGYEFNRKKTIPSELEINNPFSVYSKKFTSGEITRLLTTKRTGIQLPKESEFSHQIKLIEKAQHGAEYSLLHLCAFSIASTATYGPTPMEILSKNNNLVDFITLVLEMQIEAGNDVISIPHFNIPLSNLKKILTSIDRDLEKIGSIPFITIDLRYAKFPELLEFITSELNSNIINLTYRKYRETRPNYKELQKYVRKNIAFVLTEIERIDFEHQNLSTMHYMPFLGNDLYAIDLPPPNIQKPNAPPKTRNIANLRIFDSNDLTIVPLINQTISNSTILEQMGSENYEFLAEKLNSIGEASNDNTKYDIINAITKVHELTVSSQEMNSLQSHIDQRSSKDYVQSKLKFEQSLPQP